MNTRSKFVAVVGSGLILASSVMTGFAAGNDTGDATVSITSNTTDNVISVLISDGVFGSHAYSLGDQDVSTAMTVTVDDMRGTEAGWTVKLKATDFNPDPLTSSANAAAFDIENLTLTPGAPAVVDPVAQPAANTDGQDVNTLDPVLETDQALWTATNGNGAGEFDLVLDGDLTIPGGTLVGNYKSIVTVTLDAAP